MIIVTKDQEKIIDAFFHLANENPHRRITIKMLSEEVGMSREAIYRYHFKGVKKMIPTIHWIIEHEISENYEKNVTRDDFNFPHFLSETLLPRLYEKREWIKILHTTHTSYGWVSFLEKKYCPLVENYLNKIDKKSTLPNALLAQIIVKNFLSLLDIWLTSEEPDPVPLFKKKLILIFHQSLADMLTKTSKFY